MSEESELHRRDFPLEDLDVERLRALNSIANSQNGATKDGPANFTVPLSSLLQFPAFGVSAPNVPGPSAPPPSEQPAMPDSNDAAADMHPQAPRIPPDPPKRMHIPDQFVTPQSARSASLDSMMESTSPAVPTVRALHMTDNFVDKQLHQTTPAVDAYVGPLEGIQLPGIPSLFGGEQKQDKAQPQFSMPGVPSLFGGEQKQDKAQPQFSMPGVPSLFGGEQKQDKAQPQFSMPGVPSLFGGEQKQDQAQPQFSMPGVPSLFGGEQKQDKAQPQFSMPGVPSLFGGEQKPPEGQRDIAMPAIPSLFGGDEKAPASSQFSILGMSSVFGCDNPREPESPKYGLKFPSWGNSQEQPQEAPKQVLSDHVGQGEIQTHAASYTTATPPSSRPVPHTYPLVGSMSPTSPPSARALEMSSEGSPTLHAKLSPSRSITPPRSASFNRNAHVKTSLCAPVEQSFAFKRDVPTYSPQQEPDAHKPGSYPNTSILVVNTSPKLLSQEPPPRLSLLKPEVNNAGNAERDVKPETVTAISARDAEPPANVETEFGMFCVHALVLLICAVICFQ